MTESTKLIEAIILATKAHSNQRDLSGEPYIFHPLRVMMDNGLKTETERIAGILHDTIEDTSITEEDLKKAKFSDNIIEVVRLLTRKKGTSYKEYIVSCCKNKIARQVKRADIADNTRAERMYKFDWKLRKRLESKYENALSYMDNLKY